MDAAHMLDGLNEGQRAAVTCPSTPVCVLAGAGSGKTRVLTRRIAYRALNGDHDPRHVLALTFTRKAAGELASRLRALGLRDSVAAGTFHAVAYAQLRTRWADRGVRPPELLDRKVGFVARLLSAADRPSVLDIVTEIEWAKARAIAPDEYGAEANRLSRRAPLAYRDMAKVFQRYEDAKRERRMVDFDDLLRLCRRDLLEDSEFATSQRWRFQHVFVDEFQDVNPLQRNLLEAWLGGRQDLCVVGDPNQAIYGWNGADPSAITGFADRYPSAEVIRLTENYRSSPQILAVANAVLAGGALDGTASAHDASASALGANRPDGPAPVVRGLDDDAAEARAIARAVRDHHGPNQRWSAQAVLCRTNAQTAVIERALHQASIPFRVRGGAGLLEQPEVKIALRGLQSHTGDFAIAVADLQGDDGSEDAAAGDGPGEGADERAANLAALVRMAQDYAAIDAKPTGTGFVAWLTDTARADQPDGSGDGVEIATFHAAKGLEWPIVHLAGLEQGLVPIGHARDADALAEERRLFYVAVTRAESELICTWSEERTFGTRVAKRSRSPYLDEVDGAIAALRSGDVPADWVSHLRAQRQRLADVAGNGGTTRRRSLSGSGPAGARAAHDTRRSPVASELEGADRTVFDALKTWRLERSRAAKVPAYVIFPDRVLVEVATQRPESLADLLAVSGVGEVKVQRFGEEILGIVAEHGAS